MVAAYHPLPQGSIHEKVSFQGNASQKKKVIESGQTEETNFGDRFENLRSFLEFAHAEEDQVIR